LHEGRGGGAPDGEEEGLTKKARRNLGKFFEYRKGGEAAFTMLKKGRIKEVARRRKNKHIPRFVEKNRRSRKRDRNGKGVHSRRRKGLKGVNGDREVSSKGRPRGTKRAAPRNPRSGGGSTGKLTERSSEGGDMGSVRNLDRSVLDGGANRGRGNTGVEGGLEPFS